MGKLLVRFQVLATTVNMTVFRDVVPCSLVADVSVNLTVTIIRAMEAVSTFDLR
jgi:hypothetical protein